MLYFPDAPEVLLTLIITISFLATLGSFLDLKDRLLSLPANKL